MSRNLTVLGIPKGETWPEMSSGVDSSTVLALAINRLAVLVGAQDAVRGTQHSLALTDGATLAQPMATTDDMMNAIDACTQFSTGAGNDDVNREACTVTCLSLTNTIFLLKMPVIEGY